MLSNHDGILFAAYLQDECDAKSNEAVVAHLPFIAGDSLATKKQYYLCERIEEKLGVENPWTEFNSPDWPWYELPVSKRVASNYISEHYEQYAATKRDRLTNEKVWAVYKHTSPSGKSYIGITGRDFSARWRNGDGYETQPFYNAVQKYGWDSFVHFALYRKKWVSIEQRNENDFHCYNLRTAKKYEIEFIERDNTLMPFGYNATRGGDFTCNYF